MDGLVQFGNEMQGVKLASDAETNALADPTELCECPLWALADSRLSQMC